MCAYVAANQTNTYKIPQKKIGPKNKGFGCEGAEGEVFILFGRRAD